MARPEHTERAAEFSRALRRRLTISEARVWGAIKAERLGARFRRQVPIGPWIVDFACLDPKLVVEIDDDSHDWRDETDRTQYLQQQGFTVLRFWNKEVARDFDDVVGTIGNWVRILKEGGVPED